MLGGQLTMPVQDVGRRLDLFGIAGAMCRNLSSSRALPADFFQLSRNLRTARTRRLQVLLRVALDLRLAMLPALNLVSQSLQPGGKFRPVNRRRKRLRLEEAALLQRMRVAVLTLGYVEDNDVRVKLRRGITIDRTGGIVLEGRRNELARLLRLPDVAHPRLGVPLKLVESDLNTLPVGFTHTLVAAHQRG